MWEHMTIDQIFTALIIKDLHPKDNFRRDVIHEVTKWAKEHKDSNMPSSDMGLFLHTSKFIHSEQDNSKLTTYQTGGKKFSKFPKGKASDAYNLTPTDADAVVDNGKRFSGEVLKSKNIKCLNSRRNKVPYVAVKTVAHFVAIVTQIPSIQARQHVSQMFLSKILKMSLLWTPGIAVHAESHCCWCINRLGFNFC